MTPPDQGKRKNKAPASSQQDGKPLKNGGFTFDQIPQWIPSQVIFDPSTAQSHLFQALARTLPRHDYEAESVQKLILGRMKGPERDKKLALFEQAKLSSGFVCFDLTGQLLFGKDWFIKGSSELEIERMLRMYSQGAIPLNDPRIIDLMKDPAFSERLMKENRNRKERKKPLGFPGADLFDLARNWTAPDAPLWMMNNEAGSRSLSFFIHKKAGHVSIENFAQMIKRNDLVRFGTFPIKNLTIIRDGSLKLEFSKWLLRLMEV